MGTKLSKKKKNTLSDTIALIPPTKTDKLIKNDTNKYIACQNKNRPPTKTDKLIKNDTNKYIACQNKNRVLINISEEIYDFVYKLKNNTWHSWENDICISCHQSNHEGFENPENRTLYIKHPGTRTIESGAALITSNIEKNINDTFIELEQQVKQSQLFCVKTYRKATYEKHVILSIDNVMCDYLKCNSYEDKNGIVVTCHDWECPGLTEMDSFNKLMLNFSKNLYLDICKNTHDFINPDLVFEHRDRIKIALVNLAALAYQQHQQETKNKKTQATNLIWQQQFQDKNEMQILLDNKYFIADFKTLIVRYRNQAINNISIKDIKHYFINVQSEKEKLQIFFHLYTVLSYPRCVVFCGSKTRVNWLAKIIKNNCKENVCCLHVDTPLAEQNEKIRQFAQNEYNILITADHALSCNFEPNITIVINYDTPIRSRDYMYRIGYDESLSQHQRTSYHLITNEQQHIITKLENYYCTMFEEIFFRE